MQVVEAETDVKKEMLACTKEKGRDRAHSSAEAID
jgi:hypothetical protein